MTDSTSEIPEPSKTEEEAPLSKWDERVQSFAKAVGKSPEQISAALVGLTGAPSDEAALVLADSSALTDDDLKSVLVVGEGPKIPLGLFRKNLALLRGPALATPAASVVGATPGPSFDLLPQVPDDTSFLQMLKTGGVLKIGETEVIAGVRAALADAVNVFDLPDTILKQMEEFSEQQEEPLGEHFYRLQKLVTEKKYGEVLSALKVPGQFVSEGRKSKLLAKLRSELWSTVRGFNDQLKVWQETWTAGMANPGVLLAALALGQAGRSGMLPPGVMQAPDTATIRDAADGVIDKINRVFSGPGIPVARALAHDATRIKNLLEDPSLPAALGAANRDQMLKMLEVNVSSDYVRLEQNITRYVLSIMQLPKVTAGEGEYSYLAAMIQLGAAIPWDKLPGSGSVPNRRVPESVGIGRHTTVRGY